MVIELSPKEYELLEILIKNKGKILDRDFLYEKVWWDRDVSEKVLETINVHIAHLRRKLSPELIRTVKLVWYIID
jgi:two-component system alkaline phosphatase synthesis response regulator PhoP